MNVNGSVPSAAPSTLRRSPDASSAPPLVSTVATMSTPSVSLSCLVMKPTARSGIVRGIPANTIGRLMIDSAPAAAAHRRLASAMSSSRSLR